jgi:hypothetical protein
MENVRISSDWKNSYCGISLKTELNFFAGISSQSLNFSKKGNIKKRKY